MKRIKLIVAYDGTNYCGWQLQKNGITIEEVLNRELSRLLKEEICVHGASRTDAGVHSLGNVAVFDTNTSIAPEKISYAINRSLPQDIVVQHSCEVPPDWHPRYCDSIKTYEYRILNRPFALPTRRFDTCFVYGPLDVEAMQQAASLVVGHHDFASFCAAGAQVKGTERTVTDCRVLREGEEIILRVSGNGFLYNMVRILAGTLIDMGKGRRRPEEMAAILEAKDRRKAGPTAPAKGLTMVGISYAEEPERLLAEMVN